MGHAKLRVELSILPAAPLFHRFVCDGVIVIAGWGNHDGRSHIRFGCAAGRFACPKAPTARERRTCQSRWRNYAATKRRKPLCSEPAASGQFERTGVVLELDGQRSNIHAPVIVRVPITATITAASTTRTADGPGIAGHDPQSLARQQR